MKPGWWTPVAAAWLALSLCGCVAHYRSQSVQASGGTVVSTQLDVSSTSRVGAAIIIGIMAADGLRYYRVEPDGSRTPLVSDPEPDPKRRINVQDCTRPVDPAAGNLMCR
jgi:hypothetical protein